MFFLCWFAFLVILVFNKSVVFTNFEQGRFFEHPEIKIPVSRDSRGFLLGCPDGLEPSTFRTTI